MTFKSDRGLLLVEQEHVILQYSVPDSCQTTLTDKNKFVT